jgi:predicted nucleotidyltransferase
MSTQTQKLLQRLKKGLTEIYGQRLKAVYLYGSYARKSNVEGSDLDVLVILTGFQRRAAEVRRTSELVGSLSFDYEVTISPMFIREEEWKNTEFALLRNVKAEGIAV